MKEPTEWLAESSEARNMCGICVLRVAETDNFGNVETEGRLFSCLSGLWFEVAGYRVIVVLAFAVLNLRFLLESSWNVMAHGEAREGKWRGNWRMQWVASTLHTTSEHDIKITEIA